MTSSIIQQEENNVNIDNENNENIVNDNNVDINKENKKVEEIAPLVQDRFFKEYEAFNKEIGEIDYMESRAYEKKMRNLLSSYKRNGIVLLVSLWYAKKFEELFGDTGIMFDDIIAPSRKEYLNQKACDIKNQSNETIQFAKRVNFSVSAYDGKFTNHETPSIKEDFDFYRCGADFPSNYAGLTETDVDNSHLFYFSEMIQKMQSPFEQIAEIEARTSKGTKKKMEISFVAFLIGATIMRILRNPDLGTNVEKVILSKKAKETTDEELRVLFYQMTEMVYIQYGVCIIGRLGEASVLRACESALKKAETGFVATRSTRKENKLQDIDIYIEEEKEVDYREKIRIPISIKTGKTFDKKRILGLRSETGKRKCKYFLGISKELIDSPFALKEGRIGIRGRSVGVIEVYKTKDGENCSDVKPLSFLIKDGLHLLVSEAMEELEEKAQNKQEEEILAKELEEQEKKEKEQLKLEGGSGFDL